MRKTIILTLALSLLLSVACSVKEDRTDCPCWLDYHFHVYPRNLIHLSAWNGEQLFMEEINLSDYPKYYERTLSRGMVTTAAFVGKSRMSIRQDSLIIPRGFDCDSLLTYHNLVDCRGDSAQDTVKLHKQYSTIYLKMTNDEPGPYPFRLVVRSNVCGLRYTTDEPLDGEFEIELQETFEYNSYEFRIPRQKDGSMAMDVYRGEEQIGSINLGSAILEMMSSSEAFNWDSPDLGDIYLNVDLAKSKISVQVEPWNNLDISENL